MPAMEQSPLIQATVVTALPAVPQAEDDFFQHEPHLVGVFDFDYDEIEDFQTKVQWATFFSTPCVLPCQLLFCVPCFLRQNVQWNTRAQHVAITEDGIKYVVDRHPTMCGLVCTDVGRYSKTVPFDKITDCDVYEPAGMTCCCIRNTLSTVVVDTASSSNGSNNHELILRGLEDAHAMKRTVWDMKRRQSGLGGYASAGMAKEAGPEQMKMTNQLLVEIREEMRALNQHLRSR